MTSVRSMTHSKYRQILQEDLRNSDGKPRWREQIVPLVARYRVPSIYSERLGVKIGGLVYYGTDRVDIFRRSASYVDRVLRGEKPGDLPYQQPTKYEMIVNLKTARALGLTVPPSLLARADEVIE